MSKKKIIIISVIAAVIVLGIAVAVNHYVYEHKIRYTQFKIPYLHQKNTSLNNMSKSETGDIIVFGTYEQDNDISNGKESIEWIVLSNNGSELFVVSKYGLDSKDSYKFKSRYDFDQAYYKECDTWEKCYLREWLNNDFYEEAFNALERTFIKTTYVVNNDNLEYGTKGGNDTWDKVFLLSIEEATNPYYGFKDYNTWDEARGCAPTAYAVQTKHVHVDREWHRTADGYATCMWWLRSPGRVSSWPSATGYREVTEIAKGVDTKIDITGQSTSGYIAVRPAMVIDLEMYKDTPFYDAGE